MTLLYLSTKKEVSLKDGYFVPLDLEALLVSQLGS